MNGKITHMTGYTCPPSAGGELMTVGGGRTQVGTVEDPGPQPGHLDRQCDRPGAEHGDQQRADQVREDPGHDALADPRVDRRDRAARSAVAPSGYHGGRHRSAEQQDPCEHDERIDLRSRQPRVGGIFTESERCHRVHDQAEHDARAGPDGQRGRGHPRPPRGHPEEGDHVEGRQDQQRDLALPGRAAGRCARQVGAGISGSIKDTQVNT